jgi:paraquat-inducible protein B
VLGGVALLVGAILLFAGLHLGTPQFHAVTYFKGSVAGLDVGAPVTFRGVRVGSVTRIGLNIDLKDLSARIPVELDVDASRVSLGGPDDDDTKKTFLRLRRAGLQAQLSLQSLISGQLAVDLDLRPGVRPNWVGYPLAANEIPSSPSKLETLEAEIAALPLKQIADQSLQTLQSIHHVSDQHGTRVGGRPKRRMRPSMRPRSRQPTSTVWPSPARPSSPPTGISCIACWSLRTRPRATPTPSSPLSMR